MPGVCRAAWSQGNLPMSLTYKLIRALMRAFFKQLYTNLAWSYDAVAWLASAGQWRTWQRAGLQELPHGMTLELGFGTGNIMLELLQRRIPALGIDPSAQMARLAARRLRRAGLAAPPLCRARAQALPFPPATFQAILSTFPTEYILAPATIAEIGRVLAPGGRLVALLGVVDLQGSQPPHNPMLRLADWLVQGLYQLTGEAVQAGQGQSSTLASALENAGLHGGTECIQLPRARLLRLVAIKHPISN